MFLKTPIENFTVAISSILSLEKPFFQILVSRTFFHAIRLQQFAVVYTMKILWWLIINLFQLHWLWCENTEDYCYPIIVHSKVLGKEFV